MTQHAAPTINAGGRLLSLAEPVVMGILNLTPDSFYAASRSQTERAVAERAQAIVAEGGAIIDAGAYSTRPGAAPVSAEEESERLRRGLAVVRRELPDAVLSVDTFRPDVARMAVEEFGVAIINDVSGGNPGGSFGGTELHGDASCATDESEAPPMFRMAARLRVPYVLMSSCPDLRSVMLDIESKAQLLHSLGVGDVIADPGFGFGKTLESNYAIMSGLGAMRGLGLPLLVGVSRKSMITRLLGCETPAALNGTTALNMAALMGGAAILRVHDVRQAAECVKISRKLESESSQTERIQDMNL